MNQRIQGPKSAVWVKAVFLTDINDRVLESQVESARLPPGARLATPEECVAFYNTTDSFRDDLNLNGSAWTSQIGLTTSGMRSDGSFHSGGSGRVTVSAFLDWDKSLLVVASIGPNVRARIAFVFDDPKLEADYAAKSAQRK